MIINNFLENISLDNYIIYGMIFGCYADVCERIDKSDDVKYIIYIVQNSLNTHWDTVL